ncbi:pirin family protein [Acidithiobacillus sp. M4-SHS-6]|uniref:pirin family protein n=1 Tax=Acidithiobacillus sp. M4-SHS-6 TaxID=3383024 RepID=UPI0039BEC19B
MKENSLRAIERLVSGRPTSDGAGVRLTRLFERDLQRRLDPFLMLDFFGSETPDDYLAGFPDHPHRGFETITYMLEGRMRHRDSAGHEGLLETGGMQWMIAGRGVIHSELPEQNEGRMAGFQLWLNLPAADKLCAPWYRDFPAEELPRFTLANGITGIVLAGKSQGVIGAVQRPITEPLILDLHLPAGARFEQEIPADRHAFLVPYTGEVQVLGQSVSAAQLGILGPGEAVELQGTEASRVLLVAGQALDEPIVQYGPFVMNDEPGIRTAMEDFRAGRLA